MEPTRSSCLVVRARAVWTVLALLSLLAAVPGLTAYADDAGYALAFDGINDLVLLPDTVSVMGAGWETGKTVSLWVKPTGSALTCAYNNVAECDAIFGDRSRWWGIVRGVLNGQDRLWVWNYDASSGSPFDILPVDYVPGKWVHVTLVHGAGSLRAYRNG
ncbi:MAG TPA: LamG-like jellyroll fold domain-containing protein, partial [Anaerolineales bacterium]|nr:LamG-like jellyroll fold domain-containing protein [Anaerolineales bacterium]